MSNIKLAYMYLDTYNSILTEDALLFIEGLIDKFSDRLDKLLDDRTERQKTYDSGTLPDFLLETKSIRESNWKIKDIPATIQDRRVEITGPPDRKMIINAMTSGAKVYMSDFEDSLSPTWNNVMDGQVNLYDAARGTITYEHPTKGLYSLYSTSSRPVYNAQAIIFVRPRGLHLKESNVLLSGKTIPASLFDFGLFAYHSAKYLSMLHRGPFFYVPKLESYLEARWWNDVFTYTEEKLRLDNGTIKATVLIETLPAAFQMDEILYELRDHSAGLNCGRWDYIFSYIKTLKNHPSKVLPDRSEITMDVHFMNAYVDLLISTCHKRGAHAIGGMAAQIPIKNDKEANELALLKVRDDKMREVHKGHDGTWVAHPGLISLTNSIFNDFMPEDNQINKTTDGNDITRDDLLKVHKGNITIAGIKNNIAVSIEYLASWLCGQGCVPINNMMEDAATVEISRAQLWQWLKYNVKTEHNITINNDLINNEINNFKIEKLNELGNDAYNNRRYEAAIKIFFELVINKEFTTFLTIPAYEQIN